MMMMKLPRTNLEEKLVKTRNKAQNQHNFLEEIQAIFRETAEKDQYIKEALQGTSNQKNPRNSFIFDSLEKDKIFHINDIEKICIAYRLRFLKSSFYKEDIPYEAITKIRNLEEEHQTKLNGFKIIAPAKAFQLKNADDPLLFAPMGNNYYYLIHKWGRDLHPLRKISMWPFKKLENFVFSLFLLSLLLTFLLPVHYFTNSETNITSHFCLMLFFVFKWISGLAIFYGFKKGKSFSESNWKSEYFNA